MKDTKQSIILFFAAPCSMLTCGTIPITAPLLAVVAITAKVTIAFCGSTRTFRRQIMS